MSKRQQPSSAGGALAVPPERLRRRLDPGLLDFETTADVEPLAGTIGQPRALEAIEIGLDVRAPGYNLYVAGAPGSGRTATTSEYLQRRAATLPSPPDWVYVHNFTDADRPCAIRLPAGTGTVFARDLDELIRTLERELPRAFESDEHARRRTELLGEMSSRREQVEAEMTRYALERGYAIQPIPNGFVTVPLREGKPITSEQFEQLDEDERRRIETNGHELQQHLAEQARGLKRLDKELNERMRELDRDLVRAIAGPLLNELRDDYREAGAVIAHLDQIEVDLPAHIGDFAPNSEEPSPFAVLRSAERVDRLARYRANVFVDNGSREGAPVVIERNPTYYNLLGRIDYRAAFGTMVTDFRQIKPGALQRASGGFLVLQAADVLRQPFAWDALKRALAAREAHPENLGDQYLAVPTATLRPEPTALEVKVVLIGSRAVYHLLCALDDDFRELFKVKVDFAPDMPWSDEHVDVYAAFVSRVVRTNGLLHFARAAVARVVEEGARLRDDQRKLSTRLLEVSDLVTEASYWASRAGHSVVTEDDVDEAVARRRYRSNLVEERVQELIADGTVAIDTQGARVGRVNGLAVIDLGDVAFGRPSRVTATVALGEGSVTSIEREIELSGPIHSKGVLTLTGYLNATYGSEHPLALAATLSFEQSYDEIEGDSASSTELYALLSALSRIPVRQGVAVTGSVNQHGEVQAVGGVTTKIEGFFDICRARGLTGEQGVAIPAANVPHLMLRGDVVAAVAAGDFHVWSVRRVEEALELLTGVPAGEPDVEGRYPEGSLHRAVADRLAGFAATARAFRSPLGAGA